MKKNRLFFMFAALFVAAAVLFSCQKDEVPNVDVQLKSELVALDDHPDCEADCIEAGSENYYPVSDVAELSVGKNTKSVSYTAYNTETHFVVEVTYAITDGSSNAKATVTIDIDGDEMEHTGVSPGSTVSHTVALAGGWAGCDEIVFSILQEGLGGPISFNESYDLIPVCLGEGDVFSPITGEIWMDRNLGASQVATSSTDVDSYGDLYQWGRGTDGHQLRNSGTTATLSNIDNPGHGNFITPDANPWDWRSTTNDNLWQGVSGTNNPCPIGYRLPTEAEWEAEFESWSSKDADGAFASPLKLPVAGYRFFNGGSLNYVGSSGWYWSSTVGGSIGSQYLVFSDLVGTYESYRAFGNSVRCIKD